MNANARYKKSVALFTGNLATVFYTMLAPVLTYLLTKLKIMKTYVLTVSEFFPKTHSKAGLPTGFINSISNNSKKHTIRGNYELWKKRFDKINAGDACLSVRYWTGKPYRSPQKEVFNLTKTDGIGLEKIRLWELFRDKPYFLNKEGNILDVDVNELSKNDGLIKSDFKQWFEKYNLIEPMAVIHFTSFRYWC